MTAYIKKIREGEDPSSAVRKLLFKAAKEKFSLDMDLCDIVKDERGKPFDKNGRFFFSLSHSKSLAAVAISKFPCGTDIQKITHISDGALKKIGLLPPFPESDSERTALWTLAESYVKMTGCGISGKMKLPNFSRKIRIGNKFVKVKSDSDVLFEIKETDGYVIAVCIRTAE